MRAHLIEGANVDPVTEQEGGEEVSLHEANGGVYAFAGGRQAFVQLVDPFAQAEAGAGEGDAAIRAPMNGRLVKVAVADGERVEAGQQLAVVEAMKMEHALVAPFEASVAEVRCAVGDQVTEGAMLVRLEPRG